jgi:hypothetical protein
MALYWISVGLRKPASVRLLLISGEKLYFSNFIRSLLKIKQAAISLPSVLMKTFPGFQCKGTCSSLVKSYSEEG